MFEIDLASTVIGYIVGVLLCYSTTHLLFGDVNHEDE